MEISSVAHHTSCPSFDFIKLTVARPLSLVVNNLAAMVARSKSHEKHHLYDDFIFRNSELYILDNRIEMEFFSHTFPV